MNIGIPPLKRLNARIAIEKITTNAILMATLCGIIDVKEKDAYYDVIIVHRSSILLVGIVRDIL